MASIWALPFELKQAICAHIPKIDVANLAVASLAFGDSNVYNQFAAIQYENVTLRVDSKKGLSFSAINGLNRNGFLIRRVHAVIRGNEILTKALFFLLRMLPENQLLELTFDDESALNMYTISDYEKLIQAQKNLQLIDIPRYEFTPSVKTAETPTQIPDRAKEMKVLSKRRLKKKNAGLVRELSKDELLKKVDLHFRIRIPAGHSKTRQQHVVVRAGAPLRLIRQMIQERTDGGRIDSLSISKTHERADSVALTRLFLDIRIQGPLPLSELRLNGMEIGVYGKHIHKDIDITHLTTLELRNCPKTSHFLQALQSHPLQLKTFIYEDCVLDTSPSRRHDVLFSQLTNFLRAFRGVEHLDVEIHERGEIGFFPWNLWYMLDTQKETLRTARLSWGGLVPEDFDWMLNNCPLMDRTIRFLVEAIKAWRRREGDVVYRGKENV